MKNYLIAGASSGIGRATAQQLAREGNRVWATYHQNKMPDENNLTYLPLNVLEDTFSLDTLPDVLDGLVYCPGSINLKPFARISADAFREDYDLQVVGAVKIIQAILPKLKKSEQASIVLFSTVAVQSGFNFHSLVSASKGALEGLTRSLAAEFAPKIRVNAIAPSLTDTPLASKLLSTEAKIEANAQRHPLKRIGSPQDMAQATNFLLSEKSSWISGQVLGVDGGMSVLKI